MGKTPNSSADSQQDLHKLPSGCCPSGGNQDRSLQDSEGNLACQPCVCEENPLGTRSEHGLRPSPGQGFSKDPRAAVSAFGLAALSSPRHNPYSWASPQTPYLVTDQIPLLLIVILPQEPGLVGRQVHGALRREPESTGLKTPYTQRRERESMQAFPLLGPRLHPNTLWLIRRAPRDATFLPPPFIFSSVWLSSVFQFGELRLTLF